MANFLLIAFSILFGGIFAYKPLLCMAKAGDKTAEMKKYQSEFILAGIIIIGCLARTVFLEFFPYGLNQDEASIGYEAFSLANYGVDRNGLSYPIHFISWGSGQNALYAYIAIPFVKVLGLSVLSTRLPMAIIGCVSIYVFYFLAKQLMPKHAVFATFFFAISPWHIEKSRWALESNIFPDIFLLGVLLLVLAINGKKYCYFLSGLVFAISTYSYGTSYFILPIFCVATLIILLSKRKISLLDCTNLMATIAILSLPMIIFVLLNYSSYESIEFFGVTIPKLYQNRQTFIFNLDGTFFTSIFANFKTAIGIIFTQYDGLVWSGMPFFGVAYAILSPFFVFGVYKSIREKDDCEIPMQVWLFTSILMMFFIEANINRSNILFIPLIYFTAKGITPLLDKKVLGKHATKIVALCLCVLFFAFSSCYFGREHQESLSFQFFAGAGDAMVSANENFESVYVTSSINEPYITYLFYMQISPYEYLETREVYNPDESFEYISSINNFTFFDIDPDDLQENECYIAFSYNESDIDQSVFNIEYFGEFIIISKK
ncbi:MAG: glycosyltransferase family 39 protein [Bacillota bacterium]